MEKGKPVERRGRKVTGLKGMELQGSGTARECCSVDRLQVT